MNKIQDNAEGYIAQLPDVRSDSKRADQGLSNSAILNLYGTVRSIISLLNGKLRRGDGSQSSRTGNLFGQYIEWTFPSTPDVQVEIPHGLGRTPAGYNIVRKDRAGIVYDSNTGGWGPELFYLKCDEASLTCTIEVF